MALPPISIDVTADTTQAEASFRRVEGSAMAMGKNLGTASGHAKTYGTQINKASMHTANLTAQFNDIGVMLASGQSPLMLAMQQGTQINQVFAQMGGTGREALRGIGAGLASMMSPLNLATIGIIAGGAALVQFGMSALRAGEETLTFEDRLDALTEAVGRYREFADLAGTETDELQEKFGRAATGAQEVADALAVWARIDAVEALNASVDELAATFGDLNGEAAALDEDQIAAYAEALGVTTDVMRTFSEEAIGGLVRIRDEFGISTESATQLMMALRDFGNAEGVNAQVAAASDLNDMFARVFGSAEKIPPELREVARQASMIALQAAEVEGALQDVVTTSEAILATIGQIGGGMGNLVTLGGSFRDVMGEAAQNVQAVLRDMRVQAQAASASQQGRGAAGPGGPMVGDTAGLFEASTGVFVPGKQSAGGVGGISGGGGGVDTFGADLEALQERLMTETELAQSAYEDRLQMLRDARERELLTNEEYNDLEQRLKAEHAEKMLDIDVWRYGNSMDQAQAFFGKSARALMSGNEKMVEIGRKFAAIEATINAGRAFAQVAADPSLPWFAKIPAAIGVASAISQFANQSGIGGGGGGGAAAAAQVEATSPQTQNVTIDLVGASGAQVDQFQIFADTLNEAARQGLLTNLSVRGV